MNDEIKVIVEDCLKQVAFEQNDRITRAWLAQSINKAISESCVAHQPVIVICDETTNPPELIEQNGIAGWLSVGEEPPLIMAFQMGPQWLTVLDCE